MLSKILSWFSKHEDIEKVKELDISEPVISLLEAMKEPKRFKLDLSQQSLVKMWREYLKTITYGPTSLTLLLTDTKTQEQFTVGLTGVSIERLFCSGKFYLEGGTINSIKCTAFYYSGSPFTKCEEEILKSVTGDLVSIQVKRLARVCKYLDLRAKGKAEGQRALTATTARRKLMKVYVNEN